jgi:HlyD family secretion protein
MKGFTKRRIIIVAIAVLIVAICLGLVYARTLKKEKTSTEYSFGEITRGDLENLVTATGTLSAVGTVEVGTQVSGTLAQILVDFNDKVHKGQVLAVLDATLLEAAVQDAQAGLMSAKAQYEQAQADYDRNLQLSQKGYLSEQEFLPIKTAVQIKAATLKSAEAAVDRATANLRYAVIKSPIDGTIIQRNNEPGQTVAASLSAPTLFVVAENLTDMQILTAVDETDIGQIKEGQPVRFTVQADPDRKFVGTVSQIRLQPSTVQNVVNYTVVVNAKNDQGLLLPGMTATVDFLVDQRKGVLQAPNAALRLVPTKEMMAAVRGSLGEGRGAGRDTSRAGRAGRDSASRAGGRLGGAAGAGAMWSPGQGSSAGQGNHKMIWYLGSDGGLKAAAVETGITDGRTTEIVSGRDVSEGMKIITSLGQASAASAAKGSQPGGPRFRLF